MKRCVIFCAGPLGKADYQPAAGDVVLCADGGWHHAAALGVRPDLLLIIPTRIPPHKASRQVAAGQQRMKMCTLNFASLSPCAVSSLELLREGPSYTADTLAQIAAIWPGAELYFLCGGDMFRTVHAWKRPEEIFARAVLCEGEKQPCDLCAACKKCLNGSHPDVHYVAPEKNTIKVDQIRALTEALSLASYEGGRKIAIIERADAMNESAQNALLKTIEEPEPYAVIFLL